MLEVLYEAFLAEGEWPTFQYAATNVWQELDAELREVYFALSATGFVWPSIDRPSSFRLRDDTRVGVSLRGLMHLREAANDLAQFVRAVQQIADRAARFRPPTAPKSTNRAATVTSF
jgi:hypothetical protein